MTNENLPNGNKNDIDSIPSRLKWPAIIVLAFGFGYYAGNNFGIIDIELFGHSISAKPGERVERTMDRLLQDPIEKPAVIDYIVRTIKKSKYNDELGEKLLESAELPSDPFQWDFTDNLILKYQKGLPPDYFEVCQDSPWLGKEIVVAIFDSNGKNENATAVRGSTGSIYNKYSSCDKSNIYTSNKELFDESRRGGSEAKAKRLLTIPRTPR